jgi:hypothetical protein
MAHPANPVAWLVCAPLHMLSSGPSEVLVILLLETTDGSVVPSKVHATSLLGISKWVSDSSVPLLSMPGGLIVGLHRSLMQHRLLTFLYVGVTLHFA